MGQTRMVLMYGAPLIGLVYDDDGIMADTLYELTTGRAQVGCIKSSYHACTPKILGVCLTDPYCDDLVIHLDSADVFVTEDVRVRWQEFVGKAQDVLKITLCEPTLWFCPVEVA